MVNQSNTEMDTEIVEQDIITDALNIVKSIVEKNNGQLNDEQMKQADTLIRAKWWGDRPYIARQAGEGRSERNDAIFRDYQRGEHICYLSIKYKITKKQIRRIIESFKTGTFLS